MAGETSRISNVEEPGGSEVNVHKCIYIRHIVDNVWIVDKFVESVDKYCKQT